MKGSNTFRWAIAIGVVVAAAAFWFWHSRSESPTAAPGVAAQAPHTAAVGRRGMRDGPLAPVQAATATTQAVPRYQQLAKTNLVSRQELDAQQALVNETQGTIKADEANVASAQLQLDWSRITAPVSGRVGLKQVDVGNQISSSDTAGIVVITQTHPIDLIFTLPESDIATVVQAQKAGKTLVVEAWDRTNSHKLSEGVLLSLDNQIDPTTGTIKIKARFTNQDDTLFPNQFVNARMLVDTEQNAVVVPAAAVQMGNEGHFVWVLNDENNVSKKRVKIGIQDNRNVVISAGLSAGDRVVTDGIDRLTEGAKVEVVEPQTTVADEKSPSRHEGQKGARA
ncbi:MdtA/MuxA family multidrug efflux RND transporter periplasmic adaptor subunit [Salmonella enterica]|nr:MdtA/MuxA family multidrug efflux RND transporter periplasmic adaptor subunit [Salmonella enterica]EKB3449163.1 MdtA/MuxA family multidrug efflux RND transporter periplasmic adaptor subunit [Salmonella enterica]